MNGKCISKIIDKNRKKGVAELMYELSLAKAQRKTQRLSEKLLIYFFESYRKSPTPKKENMKVRYDNDMDAIYFDLSIPSYDSDEIRDGIIIDYDKEDNIVGIEILDFKDKVKNGLTIDNLPLRKS